MMHECEFLNACGGSVRGDTSGYHPEGAGSIPAPRLIFIESDLAVSAFDDELLVWEEEDDRESNSGKFDARREASGYS